MRNGRVANCGLCGSGKLRTLLDMGEQPLAEQFGPGGRYPLELTECGECGLVQLGYIVPQDILFPADHPYATGNTAVLRAHYAYLARSLSAGLLPGDTVIDLGANDGTLLGYYPANLERIAVEPTAQVNRCAPGIIRYRKFFTLAVSRDIVATCGRAKAVTACNVLAHVPDPHDFLAGVKNLLAHDGVFVTENHDLAAVLDGQFDTVYHEHLRYYDITSLSRLLHMHGLAAVSAEPVATHGGSVRITARHRPDASMRNAKAAARDLHDLLAKLTSDGSTVYGIGATTRAVPLIHYADIARFISCVTEVPASEKIGKDIPGTGIPVVHEQQLIAGQPEYALLLAWHLGQPLMDKLRDMGFRGRFIIPLPAPRVA